MSQKARDRRVAKAEKRDGISEGHYNLRDRGELKFVRVWIVFYPREKWLIEDVERSAKAIPDTSRVLTDDVKGRLEPWL